MDMDAVSDIKSVDLQRMMNYSISRVARDGRSVGLEPRIEREMQWATDDVVLRMRSYVWAQELQNDTSEATVVLEVQVPNTWWEHVKQRWFPEWALKRWPVVMHTVRKTETVTHKFTCMATLPDFNYVPPANCGPRYVLKTYASATRGSDGY